MALHNAEKNRDITEEFIDFVRAFFIGAVVFEREECEEEEMQKKVDKLSKKGEQGHVKRKENQQIRKHYNSEPLAATDGTYGRGKGKNRAGRNWKFFY